MDTDYFDSIKPILLLRQGRSWPGGTRTHNPSVRELNIRFALISSFDNYTTDIILLYEFNTAECSAIELQANIHFLLLIYYNIFFLKNQIR